ncbi:MAG: hypothetical protein EOM67_01025 [Spirochaetia bacterium]|nr:hypothetical protein [Spirochaetia bacterium]
MKTITPYYHRHRKIIKGEGALLALKDILISYKATTPLYIFPPNPRMEKKIASLHSTIGNSEFIQYSPDIDLSLFDSLIIYGGRDELEIYNLISIRISPSLPIIHIVSGLLEGNEYTNLKKPTDVIIYDKKVSSHLKTSEIGSMMSVMLFYLFSTAYEDTNPFTKSRLTYIVTTAASLINEERETASFGTISLLHEVGEVASNGKKVSLVSLMEHLVVPSFCTLSQSAATLLLPLVRFIKQTNTALYSTIQNTLEGQSIEEFCSYWINLSPLEGLDTILQHLITHMYQLLETKESSSTLHKFLSSLKEGKL